jgi:hypothetical protein
MRTAGRLLLLFSLAWAAFRGAPACAEENGPPVQLVAPRAGATLVAGSTAELEWAPLAGFPNLPEIEEWEAFLSLDGGATYPVRITPHLDQDLRRVRWQVPDLPTANASLLLRFGDEHRETAVELPIRFSIAPSPILADEALTRRAAAPGEPALRGQAGVVAWVEGSRRGGSLRQVVALDASGGMRTGFVAAWTHREVSEAPSQPRPSGSEDRAAAPGWGAELPAGRSSLARAGTSPSLPSDILLLIQRQNE